MSVNSSFNSSLHPLLDVCLSKTISSFLTAFIISNILLLPLFILVLYVSYQRWRKQRSVATAAMKSHSDIFTFNMVVLEMIGVLGSLLYCFGAYNYQRSLQLVGLYIFSIISPGQTLFHLLTCVERYLAVVHPITYLGLRQAGGVRIRNISIGCVWLFCFGSAGLQKFSSDVSIIYNLLFLVFASTVVSFCSLSVLCILIRPGPGDVGRNGEGQRVDQSKRKAFFTIMVIMGALLLRFLSSLVSTVMFVLYMSVFIDRPICLMMWSVACFSLPSSLVLPLLFLHRAGKLPG